LNPEDNIIFFAIKFFTVFKILIAQDTHI